MGIGRNIILRNIYTKERRKAKSTAWKDYCEAIESTKDTARLRKVLSKTHSSPAFVKNADTEYGRNLLRRPTRFCWKPTSPDVGNMVLKQ